MTLVLGIDPGGVHLGWAALDMSGEPFHVGSGVLGVDTGSDAGLVALRVAVDALLARFGPAVVGVERIARVHGHRRMGAALASGLVLAAWGGGEVAALAVARGVPVRTVTREGARKGLGLVGGAGDAAVSAAVRARVAGWPKRSSEHARDAAAVALLAGEPLRSVAA